ncbi:MAG: hypothetical protein J7501_07165 [Bdellovibrio sp.]|nr:hypothetical protein [Bdellovibrio sp.]
MKLTKIFMAIAIAATASASMAAPDCKAQSKVSINASSNPEIVRASGSSTSSAVRGTK